MTTTTRPSPDTDETSSETANLLTLLQPVFPGLQHVQVLGDPIVQASAVGYRCQLVFGPTKNNTKNHPNDGMQVFVKHVDAAVYCTTKKDWHDLRRALLYIRTEVRFYRNAQHDEYSTIILPKVYYANYTLDGLINEDEHVILPASSEKEDDMPTPQECKGKGGLLVLELLQSYDFYQASPLTMEQCKQCLTAVAALHKVAWEDVALLTRAEEQLSSPSFHLKLRNPKELAGIEGAWENFRQAFREDLFAFEDGTLWARSATLATRLKHNAAYVSQRLSPSPTDQYATLVHGDYKAMNILLNRNGSAKLVDFASSGVGNPMMDVAMHIHHAVMPEDLAAKHPTGAGRDGEMELVEHYLVALGVGDDYPKDVALRHYKLALVDYLRFFMARMWASATPDTMKSKLQNPNINNINRYPSAAMAFIDRGERYLTEIEMERKQFAAG